MRVRGARLTQPIRPVQINWGDWLAHELVFAFNGGAAAVDAVTCVAGALSGTTVPTQKPTSSGTGQLWSGYDFTGTTYGASYIDFGTHALTANLATNPTTWAFLFYAPATTSNVQLMERNDGNTVNAGWAIQTTSAGGAVQCVIERATANAQADANGGTVASAWNTAVVTTPGDGAAASVLFYVNGIARSTNVFTAGSGAQGDDSTRSLYLGRSIYNNKSNNGNIAVALIARRIWGLAEAEAFNANPWRVWRQPRVFSQGFGGLVPWRFFLG